MAAGLGAVLLSWGCNAEIEGPRPQVAGLDPALACGEQITTVVRLSGEGLSPLAIDAATGDPLLALPDVRLQRVRDLDNTPASAEPVTLPNDPAAPQDARVRWESQTSMTFEIYPELGLVPGVYDVTVENRNGNAFTRPGALVVVGRPALESVEPDLFCVEQGARALVLRGEGFVAVGGELPVVRFGAEGFVVSSMEDCTDLPGPTAGRVCRTAHVTVPEDALAAGAYDVALENPEPASCHTEEAVTAAVVPAPSLTLVEPDLLCTDQGDRVLELSGTGFVTVDGTLPEVTVGTVTLTADFASGCAPIAGTTLSAESCTGLTVTLPAGVLAPGAYGVSVRNPLPAGCQSEEANTLVIVPPPSVTAVEPDLVCLAEIDREIVIRGSGFVVIDDGAGGTFPDVSIGGVAVAPHSAGGCVPLGGTSLTAETCDSLFVTLPAGFLADGVHDVAVGNPGPAGCVSTEDVTLAVVPEPTLASVAPDLFCADDGAVSLTLAGTGFLQVGSDRPTVWFGTTPVVAESLSGCASVAGTTLSASSCTSLTVTVPPTAVPAGEQTVSVENPSPAGCSSNEAVTAFVAAAPVITAVVPMAVCESSQPATLSIEGTGFLEIEGALPSVTVDGSPVSVTGVTDCVPLPGTTLSARTCTEIVVSVPPGGFSGGSHTVVVENPAPAGCSTQSAGSFDVATAPVVVSVTPAKVCAEGSSFNVAGSGFVPGSEIELSNTTLGSFPVPTTFLSPAELKGDIAMGAVPAGVYDVTVKNGMGCEDTLAGALTVKNAPVVFFVDPPSIYNGIDLQATIYASGVTDDVTFVGIRPTGTMDPATPLSFTYDPARPNRILATLPAGTPAGDYDVIIQDVACGALLADGLHVTETLSVHVASISPPFAYTGEPQPVTLRSTDPPPTGFETFEATPRAYLNPTSGGLATEIRSVAFESATRLSGVVPDGLSVGVYDLIVVNPDGHVGLLPGAFQVVADPLPVIAALVPGLVANQSGQAVTVLGMGFRGPVTVTAMCRKPGSPDVMVTAAVGTTTGTSVDATWDLAGLVGGEVCVVRLTNADGTFAEFSALTVTNPSNNLNPFLADNAMTTARRAAAGAAIRVDSVRRFLYAMGGDAGMAGVSHASVEAAPVDPFGDVGVWSLQRNALPAPRTFIQAAAVGRYVYVPGGRVAGAPTASVLRAYLLDPFEAPEVTDLDLQTGGGAGLDGGIWTYRVAAVMDVTDANNPGGEGLASEPFVVQLPDHPDKIHLTLRWAAVPGATAYRIYRTPAPDLIAGQVGLLTTIPAPMGAPSFTDDGSLSVSPAVTPLPLGSLGTWHEVGPLAVAREGASVVAVRDPNDPELHYLYVAGGRDAGGTALRTIERATIRATAPNLQTVEAPGFVVENAPCGGASAPGCLPVGRWQAGAVAIDATRVRSTPAGQAWIYVYPGLAGGGAEVNETTAFPVDTKDGAGADDGRLGAPTAVATPSSGGGHGYVAGNGFLYVLGADNAAPSGTGRSAQVCAPGVPGCGGVTTPPQLGNWNAGITLERPRYLAATATESGFIFLLGGQTAAEAASATTERTNF